MATQKSKERTINLPSVNILKPQAPVPVLCSRYGCKKTIHV